MSHQTTPWATVWDTWLATGAHHSGCDVLVIGSGYGGGFAARELASPDTTVWVMERGRAFALGEFPEDIGQLPGQVRFQAKDSARAKGKHDAVLEFRQFDRLSVLVANGLGGGSLINAGVAVRPDDALLQDPAWPSHYRAHATHRQTFWQAVDEVERQLQVQPLEGAETLPKYRALQALGRAWGVQAQPAPLTIASRDQTSPAGVQQPACTRCGNCFTGCNVGAKNTITTHVLPQAVRQGAQVVTGATALEVLPYQGPAALTPQGRPLRWTVRMASSAAWARASDQAPTVELHCHSLVLAAGTLGSTELLLRSPRVPCSTRLGARFSTNGDVLALGWGMARRVRGMAPTEPLDPADPVGPTITGILAPTVASGGQHRPMLIEDGAVPSALTQAVLALGATLSLAHRYTRDEGPAFFGEGLAVDRLATPPALADHALLLLGMGHDDADGRLSLREGQAGAPATLAVHWADGGGPASSYYQRVHERLTQAQDAAEGEGFQGGDYLPFPLWKPLPDGFAEVMGQGPEPAGVTVHPLGGCGMGDDASTGVVDWQGRVFRPEGGLHEGLHVLDGAMLPTAVGVNPFLCISALALVAARAMAGALHRAPVHHLPPASGVAQARVATPARAAAKPLRLRFDEHLRGHPVGTQPSWWVDLVNTHLYPDRTPLPAADLPQTWVVRVQVPLDLQAWLADPGMRLTGSQLAVYRDTHPHALSVMPDTTQGSPLLVGTGWVSLLALDAPAHKPAQWWRVAAALLSFWQRRSFKGQGGEGDWWTRVQGFLRAGRNLSFYRRMDYVFTLSAPGQSKPVVTARGGKHLAYAPGKANLWDALTQMDLALSPETGGPAMTLRLEVDLIDMVRQRRLQLSQAPNTPSGIIGLASFAALWARALFQSHFWSFRGLDYALLDPPGPAQHGPLRGARAELPWVAPEVHTLQVPRYRNTPGAPCAELAHEPLALELTRYHDPGQPHAGHVLLIHGLAHGGTVFTTGTTGGRNMAASLLQRGYTVWVLDHRLSNRLPYHSQDHSMDDLAALDIPAAVDHVYRAAGGPVQVLAHCVGGGAFAMATLKGWLQDGAHSKVAAAIIHAVHPWVVPSPSNQLSGALASFYKDVLPTDLAVDPVPPRAADSGFIDQALDRLSASLPWPEAELDAHRRDEFDPAGGTAVCNRMTLFYGREWVHGNLAPETHRELASLVGPASVSVFQQLYFIINRQRLTDRDGAQVYMTESQFQQHWRFPTLFATGTENRVFDPRSAVRSWLRLRLLQERAQRRSAQLMPPVRLFMPEGYGHMDFLFGAQAHRDVYPALGDFFLNPTDFQSQAPQAEPGPLDQGRAQNDHASLLPRWQDHAVDEPLAVLTGPQIELAQDGERRQLVVWLELAHDPARPVTALQAHAPQAAVTWQAQRLTQVHAPGSGVPRDATLLQGAGQYWVGRLTEARPGALAEAGPVFFSADGQPLGAALNWAHLPWWQRWTGQAVPYPVSWLAWSCRWPGLPFEREAIDAVAAHMLAHARDPQRPVDAVLLLGDQIYADASADLIQTRESDERLAGLYRDAGSGPHTRALLQTLPSYRVIDDHEYRDNWQGGARPAQDAGLVDGFEAALAYQWRWDHPSRHAPQLGPGPVRGFWKPFVLGGLPAFALDTRTERALRTPEGWRQAAMIGQAQMDALKTWLLAHRDQPKLICSGSVFGLPDRRLVHDPALCASDDDWEGYPASWRELVTFVVQHQIQRLIFMAGDYHFSAAARLQLRADTLGPPVAALSVVSSGWNASLPFANSQPSDFVLDQAVDYPGSDAQVTVVCDAQALSTALRQFSKLSLLPQPGGGWQLAVQVYDAQGHAVADWAAGL